jgi:hypothetical protein
MADSNVLRRVLFGISRSSIPPVRRGSHVMAPNEPSSLAIVTIFLLCLSTFIISLRFWVRFSIKYLGLDDWFMLFGQASLLSISAQLRIRVDTSDVVDGYRYYSSDAALPLSLALITVLVLGTYI